MSAAEVLHRLPAGALEGTPERDRVRHRRDPARRLREDPGMHRPAPSDVDAHFGRAVEEAPRARRAGRAGQAALAESDFDAAQAPSRARARARGGVALAAGRAEGVDAGCRARRRARPRRLLARATWKRVLVIFAGPGRTSSSRCSVRAPPHGRRAARLDESRTTRPVEDATRSPARGAIGLRPAIASSRSTASRSATSAMIEHDQRSSGKPIRITVVRDGESRRSAVRPFEAGPTGATASAPAPRRSGPGCQSPPGSRYALPGS